MRAYESNRQWAKSQLVGLAEEAARAAASTHGLDVRVVARDGRNLFRTDDRVLTRVNVVVRSDRVTRVVGLF